MSIILSAHQPNFFPFFPFFQKMDRSDVFVILSQVQFEKNNYQNRFQLNDKWHTMRVPRGTRSIKDQTYINAKADWKLLKSNLKEYSDTLSLFDDCIFDSLSLTNETIIKRCVSILEIKTKITIDYPTELKATERLVDICKTNGATTYLSGISGRNYLNLELFEEAGIKVIFQEEKEMLKIPIIEILNAL